MMENGITLNIPEFRAALTEYRQWTKRDLPTILNTKGFHIALRAVADTKRVAQETISKDLKEIFQGQNVKKFSRITYNALGLISGSAPVAALLINFRKGQTGQAGLYGQAMTDAINRFVSSRRSSAGFFASGWLPSVKRLGNLANRDATRPATDRAVKQLGPDHGYAIPAVESFMPVVELVNTANSKTDKTGALPRYAGAGFEAAVRDEIVSMREYIERKMQERADQFAGRN